jgi:hypothetical protein
MAPSAKPGIGLREAEMWRKYAWQRPFQACPDDGWDTVTRSFPARLTETCRHKVAWLKQMVGGEVVVGKKDATNATPSFTRFWRSTSAATT